MCSSYHEKSCCRNKYHVQIIFYITHLCTIANENNVNIVFMWTLSNLGVRRNEHTDYLARAIIENIVDISTDKNVADDIAILYTDFMLL